MAKTSNNGAEAGLVSDIALESEMIVALVSDPNAINRYGIYLNSETFTLRDYREIYNAIVRISNKGLEVDIISIIHELKSSGSEMDEFTVLTYSQSDHYRINALRVAERLQLLYKRRELNRLGRQLTDMTSKEVEPIERMQSMLSDYLKDAGKGMKKVNLGEGKKRLRKRVEENALDNRPSGTLTGFSRLDELGGFHKGEFIVVAGDTSNGKTSFALSVAYNAIFNKEKLAYYSLEMTCEELTARLVAINSSLSSSSLLFRKMYLNERFRMEKAFENLPDDSLFFEDNVSNGFEYILSSIRAYYYTEGIKGAIIDYLQILNINNNGRETQEQLMAIVARSLKNLALELGIWIMAISQLNRDSQNPQPSLSRLRSSGQIAEAADIVLLVYRPEIYGRNYIEKEFSMKDTHHTALIDIAKGRSIGTGKFLCRFEPQITFFYEGEIQDKVKEEKVDEAITGSVVVGPGNNLNKPGFLDEDPEEKKYSPTEGDLPF